LDRQQIRAQVLARSKRSRRSCCVPSVERNFGHAEDAVQRRANLVALGRQELALHAVGLLELAAAAASERGLGGAAPPGFVHAAKSGARSSGRSRRCPRRVSTRFSAGRLTRSGAVISIPMGFAAGGVIDQKPGRCLRYAHGAFVPSSCEIEIGGDGPAFAERHL
jgi:hypothetical protein